MPTNTAPFEIIFAPFTAYFAPVGEAFPVIDAAPAGNWAKIGSSGPRNYESEGVTVVHGQTIEMFRGLGATGPVKVSRTEEVLSIRFTLVDFSLEHYRLALNNNAVAITAAGSGTAGFKELPTYRGVTVQTMALLLRGDVSPYGDGWNSQYEVPVAFETGSPQPAFRKNAPGAFALDFTALEDPNAASDAARFGRLVSQHQEALP